MSEIEQAQSLSEWEALKRMVPSWQNAPVEPFLPPADSGVAQPVWNKVDLGQGSSSSSNINGSTPQPGAITTIAGMQVGSTFVPVLITHVEGTIYTEL